jgi:hypothetical protein
VAYDPISATMASTESPLVKMDILDSVDDDDDDDDDEIPNNTVCVATTLDVGRWNGALPPPP